MVGFILAGFRAFAAGDDTQKSPPAELTIAAAADLKFALDDLTKEFKEQFPAAKINVTYGSSGNFFAQLQNGAPFDLFFSADIAYPRKLAESGLAADDVFLYGIGCLVVWVPKNSPVAVEQLGIKSLLEPSIRKIAVANPEHAPLWSRSRSGLEITLCLRPNRIKIGVWGKHRPDRTICAKRRSRCRPSRTFARGRSADAQFGAILAGTPGSLSPMEQGGIILKATKNLESARAFRDFILGEHGREVLKQYGFSVPGK